jgi:hybrid cluster-associated redox disulfide protein
MNRMKITEQTTILEVLKAAPQTRKVFDRYKMRCKGCKGAVAETVLAGARNHGIDANDLVRDLNEAVKTGR